MPVPKLHFYSELVGGTKGRGEPCKRGERADVTGCIPKKKVGAKKGKPAAKPKRAFDSPRYSGGQLNPVRGAVNDVMDLYAEVREELKGDAPDMDLVHQKLAKADKLRAIIKKVEEEIRQSKWDEEREISREMLTSPRPRELKLQVEKASGVYQGILNDLDDLDILGIRDRFAPLKKLPRAVLAGVAESINYPTGGSKATLVGRLLGKLENTSRMRDRIAIIDDMSDRTDEFVEELSKLKKEADPKGADYDKIEEYLNRLLSSMTVKEAIAVNDALDTGWRVSSKKEAVKRIREKVLERQLARERIRH